MYRAELFTYSMIRSGVVIVIDLLRDTAAVASLGICNDAFVLLEFPIRCLKYVIFLYYCSSSVASL